MSGFEETVYQPDVVMFHQEMPQDALFEAEQAASNCSALIVIGSSLIVSPANMIPFMATRAGAWFYLFNDSATLFDDHADSIIRGDATKTVPRLVDLVIREIEGG